MSAGRTDKKLTVEPLAWRQPRAGINVFLAWLDDVQIYVQQYDDVWSLVVPAFGQYRCVLTAKDEIEAKADALRKLQAHLEWLVLIVKASQ